MRHLLALVAAIWIVLSAAMAGAHALSQLIPPSAMLSSYLCSPQPCWHGIYPGKTSKAEAEQSIRSDASLTLDKQTTDGLLCWHPSSGQGCLIQTQKIAYISANAPQSPYRNGPLIFADAISLYGPPIGLNVCTDLSNDYRVFVVLYFHAKILVASAPFYVTPSNERINLNTLIDVIQYHVDPYAAMNPWLGPSALPGISKC